MAILYVAVGFNMLDHYDRPTARCDSHGVFTPEQDNDKTKVEPVHSYDAFHTRHVRPGVKGIIGMHRFNIYLVVLLCYENTISLEM